MHGSNRFRFVLDARCADLGIRVIHNLQVFTTMTACSRTLSDLEIMSCTALYIPCIDCHDHA